MKKFLSLFILLLGSANSAYAITFNESLESAYKNNPELEAARQNLMVFDEDMPSAVAGFLPDISASYERGKRNTEIGSSTTDKIIDNRDIQLSQPLFKGGKTMSGIKKAKNTINAARAELRSVEQVVLLEAVTAYMDIIRDVEVLELTKNNVDVLQKHLDVTRERFRLGAITKTDVAQAEASLARAVSEKIAADGNLESSMATYIRVVGSEPVDLQDIENPITINASLDEIIEMSLKENPQIQAVRYSQMAAKNQVSSAKSDLLPVVDAVATRARQQGAVYSSGDMDNQSYMLNVTVPLYQSGSEYSNIRRAKFNLEKLKYDLIDQENKIREDVVRAYNDFKVSTATIESNKSSIAANKLALEGTKKEAQVGSRTTLDVLDAENDLFEAKVNLVRSKRNEIVSSYNLLAQVGRLNAKELGLKVELYDPQKNYNKRKYQIIGF